MVTLSFVTRYIVVNYCFNPKIHSGSISIYTLIAYRITTRQVYIICHVRFFQKVTLVNLVELEMVDFDINLAWICYIPSMPRSIVELGSFGICFKKSQP